MTRRALFAMAVAALAPKTKAVALGRPCLTHNVLPQVIKDELEYGLVRGYGLIRVTDYVPVRRAGEFVYADFTKKAYRVVGEGANAFILE